jgi:F0F1-type ATP synthase assembly protein I|tara:strand:+ start:1273 stop:1539 length:267 start_codon:yes stop_codon:yes gene_type:complete
LSEKEKEKGEGQIDILENFKSFQNIVKQSGPAAAASYGLIASILIFTYFGWMIDRKIDSSPFAILIGMLLGMIIGFYHLIKVVGKTKR